MQVKVPANAPLIAILEDDPFQRTWFERLLGRAAFRVRTYSDPHEFFARRAERPLPDVLLMDFVLPEMDALQVLSKLEEDEQWCTVPVVLMTASATTERVLAAERLQLRPEGFLVKPVPVESTITLLRAICDRQDPVARLRGLHRQRRSLELLMQSDLRELDQAVGGTSESTRESARRMATAQRRVQQLSRLQATSGLSWEERKPLAATIRQVEAEIEQYRLQIQSAESRHRSLQSIREAVVRRRRRIQDLDAEIAATTQSQQATT